MQRESRQREQVERVEQAKYIISAETDTADEHKKRFLPSVRNHTMFGCCTAERAIHATRLYVSEDGGPGKKPEKLPGP